MRILCHTLYRKIGIHHGESWYGWHNRNENWSLYHTARKSEIFYSQMGRLDGAEEAVAEERRRRRITYMHPEKQSKAAHQTKCLQYLHSDLPYLIALMQQEKYIKKTQDCLKLWGRIKINTACQIFDLFITNKDNTYQKQTKSQVQL